jgi:hypothetical protein
MPNSSCRTVAVCLMLARLLTACTSPETAPPSPVQVSVSTPPIVATPAPAVELPTPPQPAPPAVEWKTFDSALCGFKFSYPPSYVVAEQRTSQDCSVTVAEPSVPMQDDAPSEGPPFIVFRTFKGSAGTQSIEAWVKRAKRSIGYDAEQAGEIRTLSIAGKDAVTFMMDGLYAVHRVVFAHNGLIVTADGPFRGEHDPFHLAFSRMLMTLELRAKDGTFQSSACKELGSMCDTLQLPTCVDGHWQCMDATP